MFTVDIFLVFADLTETEKLAKLCERLKYKHAREPVILFIEENDITAGDFGLKDSDNFHIISTSSALDNLIEKYSGQSIQVYLTYRDNKSEENVALLQTFGKNRAENVVSHVSKFDELGKILQNLLQKQICFISNLFSVR